MKVTSYVLMAILTIVLLSAIGFGLRSCSIMKNHAYKNVAKEEAIIKLKANAEINNKSLEAQQEFILEQVRQKRSTGPNDKSVNKFIEDFKNDNLSWAVKKQNGVVELYNKWKEINKK